MQLGEELPAVPVLLVHAVLDRDDRVAVAERAPVLRQLLAAQHAALVLEAIRAVAVELAGGRVERDRDVLAGLVARRLDARHERLQRLLVRAEVGREAALVADGRAQPALVQPALQRVEHLGAHPQRLREALGPGRHHHELLEVDAVVGVRAAVQDVHHRHGQHARAVAAEVAVERQARLRRGRLGDREGHAQDRVRAEARLVRASRPARSARGRPPPGRWRPARSPRLAISPFTFATAWLTPLPSHSSPPSRSSTASNSPVDAPEGTAARPVRARLEPHVDLDRRVAPRVEDLARVHLAGSRS